MNQDLGEYSSPEASDIPFAQLAGSPCSQGLSPSRSEAVFFPGRTLKLGGSLLCLWNTPAPADFHHLPSRYRSQAGQVGSSTQPRGRWEIHKEEAILRGHVGATTAELQGSGELAEMRGRGCCASSGCCNGELQLDGWNNRNLFLTVLEAGSSRGVIRVLNFWMLEGEAIPCFSPVSGSCWQSSALLSSDVTCHSTSCLFTWGSLCALTSYFLTWWRHHFLGEGPPLSSMNLSQFN